MLSAMVADADLDQYEWGSESSTVTAGRWLCHEGEPVHEVLTIASGLVRLVHAGSENRPVAVGLRWPGSLIGGIGVTLDEPHRVSAIAALPTRVRRLPASRFRERLGSAPDFLSQATDAMVREFRDELEDSVRACLPHPEQRLRALLFPRSTGQNGRGTISADARLPNAVVWSDLAELLHISRDRLTQVLRGWQAAGYARFEGDAMVFSRTALCANDTSLPTEIPDRRVKDVIRLIHKRCAKEPVDLQQLSRQVNLSLWHLSRLFRRSTGVGFREFVNAVRLDRARVALETTHLSVKEIAAIAGYNHTSDLTRRFRAVHGVSPSAYRATFRGATSEA